MELHEIVEGKYETLLQLPSAGGKNSMFFVILFKECEAQFSHQRGRTLPQDSPLLISEREGFPNDLSESQAS